MTFVLNLYLQILSTHLLGNVCWQSTLTSVNKFVWYKVLPYTLQNIYSDNMTLQTSAFFFMLYQLPCITGGRARLASFNMTSYLKICCSLHTNYLAVFDWMRCVLHVTMSEDIPWYSKADSSQVRITRHFPLSWPVWRWQSERAVIFMTSNLAHLSRENILMK